jgi:hypothetical protein
MNRLLLALVAIALVIGAWLLLRKDKAPAAPEAGSAAPSASTDPSTPSTPSTSPPPRLPPTVTDTTKQIPPAGSANEYMVGDVMIRDHRSGSNAPIDIPPNIHRPNTRQLPSTLTAQVAQQIRGVLVDCAKDLPKEARGEHPRLEGTINVSIKDRKLTVTSAAYQLRDVTGDAVETTKSCVEQKSVGLSTAASDQEDIDNYSIGITFAVL